MPEPVIVTREGEGVALVRIDRPEARNALDDPTREALTIAFADLAADDAVRCAVLTGGPKLFAAGADLRALAGMSAAEMARRGPGAFAALAAFPKPLVAAVNGLALGGGCELAMLADIVVAGEGARFGQPEIRVGIMPGAGGTQRLVRLVGRAKAMRLLLTGELVGAREAEAWGLVSEVVPDGEVLDRALALARTITAMPPLAARAIKATVNAGADLPLDEALRIERRAFEGLFGTADQVEGMAAFLEKRPPRFTGT